MDQDPVLPDSYADLLAWIDPRAAEIPVMMPVRDGPDFQYWTTATVDIGLISVALALVGSLRTRSPIAPSRAPWILLGVVAVLVAGGPSLRVAGEVVQLAGGPVPLPARALNAMVPGFSITAPHCYRYASIVALAVAVLAGQSVRDRRPALLATLLVVLELVVLSPVPWPARVTVIDDSSVLTTLAGLPDGAVLSAPLRSDNLYDLGRAMLAQTVHGKPFQDGGIHARAGDASTALFADNPLAAALEARESRTLPAAEPSRRWLLDLYERGFRYLLVPVDETDVAGWAATVLGPAFQQDAIWALWQLPAKADDSSGAQDIAPSNILGKESP
jgi:hypothetical protein